MAERRSGVDPATARSRQRFARRQWARRFLTLRRVGAAVLAVLVVVALVWTVWFSSLLAVDEVSVVGTRDLSVEEVRAAAAVPDGEPLATVDLAAIRTRVESLAAVRSADVTRAWPHGVRIEIEERVAIAVVRIGGALRGMDESGVVFRSYAHAPPGLPRVDILVGTTAEALSESARVIAALPEDLATRVDHVEVQTVDEISLVLRDGRTVVWGSADDSAAKAEVLDVLLGQEAEVYDVSVPGQPTTR
ncbi:MAG: FtsQ-type POTRA domain-containing protein [Actinobacteria bacterium]|uniref:Unannotated protein n=1 Tax=freshwater metagenome TaxID=449393 RepID=A0A6J6NVJ5_9ZZZZ|nr:FtsQ-type POTRA domain-containing protein [Actinomycetota bacterium]